MKLSKIVIDKQYHALTPFALTGFGWTASAGITTYFSLGSDENLSKLLSMATFVLLIFAAIAFFRHFQSGRGKFTLLRLSEQNPDDDPNSLYAHVRFANGDGGKVRLGRLDQAKHQLRFSTTGKLEQKRSITDFDPLAKIALVMSTIALIGGIIISDLGLVFVSAMSYIPSLLEFRWKQVSTASRVSERQFDS